MLLSRPFLNGHARLNGRLGKIACFSPVFFVIFVVLNGVPYAQFRETNDKTSDQNTSMISLVFRSFFWFKNARLSPVFWVKRPCLKNLAH